MRSDQRRRVTPIFNKCLISVLGLLLLCSLFGLFTLASPTAALASDDIALRITGDGVATPAVFTLAQLQAMEQYQHVYSAINTWPTKKWYVGTGVKLTDLLALAGIKEEAALIKFTARDSFTATLTVHELLQDKRYCFPQLMDNDPNLGQVPGSPAGAEEVEPILALASAEGTDDPGYMNDMSALLLMLGQRSVIEQTGQLFVKNVAQIEVLTTEPGKWDEPKADPASGCVAPGTLVRLSNVRSDDDKIYYTTDGNDPTVNSPMYNWIASRWWSSRAEDLDSVNHPVEITRDTTIKAITIGPGKKDSDIVTFSYQVTLAAPPVVVADVTDNVAGRAIELTFADDPAWRAAITGVTVEGTPLTLDDYLVEGGKITIKAGLLQQAGDYYIAVQAEGYEYAGVTQTIVAGLKIPPELNADVTDNVAGQPVELTFAETPEWSGAITGMSVDGVALDDGEYSIDYDSIITISGDVFSTAGDYVIAIQAAGYADAAVTQVIKNISNGGNEEEPDEDVVLTITGNGVITTRTFTVNQLEEMEQYQRVYSAINTWPTKKWYVGKGVKLEDLLDKAGIKKSARQIRFIASDSFTVTLTVEELLENKRYYFPKLKDNDPNLGQIPGSTAGAKEVETILALESAEGTDNLDYMNSMNALMLMLGQQAVTEQSGQLFVKKVEKIEVLTADPGQWDEPKADPDSGSVAPGTLVKLSNNHCDDDKIHYTTDGSTPTMNSPMYNWIASRWWSSRAEDLDSVNHPIEITKDTTIKAITIGPGKEASDFVTFTYTVTKAVSSSKNKISTSTGGTVSLGTEVTIEIPAGALASDEMEVGIQKVAAPPVAPADYKLLSSVYEFSVDDKNSYSFAKSVTITISLDPGSAGAGESPAIYYYDEIKGQWVDLGGTVSGNTISVQVDHFTKFAVMTAIKEQGPVLTDITGHWAMDNINKLVAMGCVSGYPGGTFRPEHTITRAEFVTVLVKTFKLEINGSKVFTDTTAHWAKDYIATAAANGLVNGYNENIFGPDDPITREQMAVIIVKAAKLAPSAGETGFADRSKISQWAKEAVATATANRILKGYPDNTIQPQGSATRAEAVTAVINALK